MLSRSVCAMLRKGLTGEFMTSWLFWLIFLIFAIAASYSIYQLLT